MIIIDKETARKKIQRMALEIAEKNGQETRLILLGIVENGMVVASQVAQFLKDVYAGEIILSAIKIDKTKPLNISLDAEMSIAGETIILIDDVANSGRTMLYSLLPLLEHFPKSIQTLALVERTHKQFPIMLTYVGKSVSTTLDERIVVEAEGGAVSCATLI